MIAPRVIPVMIGQMALSSEPGSVLVTYSLGSCIGLTFYDPALKLGAMAHIMLPEGPSQPGEEGKYASSCVPLLVSEMERRGASRDRLQVKMAGGARILALLGPFNGPDVGSQNKAAVQRILTSLGLRITGMDCGGHYGRTMSLYVDTGTVEISTVGMGKRTI